MDLGYYIRQAAGGTTNARLQWFLLIAGHQSEATLETYLNMSTLLGGTGNDEPDTATAWTNYARSTVTQGNITIDDNQDPATVDLPDPSWTPDQSGVNIGLIGVAYVPDIVAPTADSGRLVIFLDEFITTTVASTPITYTVPSGGLWDWALG